MISRNELRTGNIVQSKVNYLQKEHTTAMFMYSVMQIKTLKCEVESIIDGYRHFLKTTHLEYSKLEGIKLTPEILVDWCGLERKKIFHDYCFELNKSKTQST